MLNRSSYRDIVHSSLSQAVTNDDTSKHGENLSSYASVGLLFRLQSRLPDLLFIKRSYSAHDPWSGHMAFPGGRQELNDKTVRQTAEREIREELGINEADLGMYIGSLKPVQARSSRRVENFQIIPQLYLLDKPDLAFQSNYEVENFFWIPFSHFFIQSNFIRIEREVYQGKHQFPAVKYGDEIIWGLSFIMLSDLLKRLHNLPVTALIEREMGIKTNTSVWDVN